MGARLSKQQRLMLEHLRETPGLTARSLQPVFGQTPYPDSVSRSLRRMEQRNLIDHVGDHHRRYFAVDEKNSALKHLAALTQEGWHLDRELNQLTKRSTRTHDQYTAALQRLYTNWPESRDPANGELREAIAELTVIKF